MTKLAEPCQPAAFSLVRIDGKLLGGAAARVHHVVGAATDGMARPGVDDVKNQRAVHWNVWVQTGGWLPGTVADAGDVLPFSSSWLQGHQAAIAKHGKAGGDQPCDFHLQALYGRVNTARRTAAGSLFAQHVPRFERMAK